MFWPLCGLPFTMLRSLSIERVAWMLACVTACNKCPVQAQRRSRSADLQKLMPSSGGSEAKLWEILEDGKVRDYEIIPKDFGNSDESEALWDWNENDAPDAPKDNGTPEVHGFRCRPERYLEDQKNVTHCYAYDSPHAWACPVGKPFYNRFSMRVESHLVGKGDHLWQLRLRLCLFKAGEPGP